MSTTSPAASLRDVLIGLFHDSPEALGQFSPISPDDMPQTARELLAHEHHMTVTVEAFHQSRVDVNVQESQLAGERYAREITLSKQSDGGVVQYGIVRIHLGFVSPEVRGQIERREAPLGRILLEHKVLMRVHLIALWELQPSAWLSELLQLERPQAVYGRTAFIYCDGAPAIELLEIVRLFDS